MQKARSALSEHFPFMVMVALLTLAMTFPTFLHVFRTDAFWLPTGGVSDAWMKFWDAWYAKLIFSGLADFYFTDKLFYPQGLSLVYHNFSIPHVLLFGGLQSFMPTSNAFNFIYLLIVASVAAASYIYLLYLFQDKWLSLLGAVIVGLCPLVVGRSYHPDIASIAGIPITLYLLHRGIAETRHRLSVSAAILTGFTSYIGMYIAVCLGISVGAYFVCFAIARWRSPSYWMVLIVFASIAGAISAPRILPMLEDKQGFDEAMSKNFGGERGTDVFESLLNLKHPTLGPIFDRVFQTDLRHLKGSSYLGYTALVLIGIGLARRRYRRQMIPWLLLFGTFLILRLGSVLTVNGVRYENVLLPKYFLNDLVPGVFSAFHAPDHFQIGALLPLAVLACYGAMTFIHAVSARRQKTIILACIALLSFEYYQPTEPFIRPDEQIAFVDWLLDEPGETRLINVPMGRYNSKSYLYHQTLHGFPQVEGLASRTPSSAYDYIKSNHILNRWRRNRPFACIEATIDDYVEAVDALLDDGFSHVIYHRTRYKASEIEASFFYMQPVYRDEFVSIYRLSDLRASCPG
ncbi:MAG: hypothetical protein OXG53_01920 [Chloroflexi bacterium]|nr:hypothetical protein [Chloroflexota bacterium]